VKKETLEEAADKAWFDYTYPNGELYSTVFIEAFKLGATWRANQPQWISVEDRLPDENRLQMSKDVLTIAGNKMSVKSYDFELKRWNGSPHITVTHWMPLPEPPKQQ
jgi:hypothetical protein